MTSTNDTTEVTLRTRVRRRPLRTFGIVVATALAVLLTLAGVGLLVADAMDIEPFMQTGHAMVPGLPAKTRFLRVPFRGRAPAPGEMVVVRDAFGSGMIVRRVIGVPGDRISLDGFAPEVNGHAIGARAACPARLRDMVCMRERLGAETWLATWSPRAVPDTVAPFAHVPRGFVYLLADHRDAARDSRDPLFGVTPFHGVVGYIVPLRRYP